MVFHSIHLPCDVLCSILLRRGIEHIQVIEREMREWMEEHEYESVEQLKGSMSQKNCPDRARSSAPST